MATTFATPQHPEPSEPINAAVFESSGDMAVLPDALDQLPGQADKLFVVSDNMRFLQRTRASVRLSWAEIGLDQENIAAGDILNALSRWIETPSSGLGLVVDMSWIANQIQGIGGIEAWGQVAERITTELGVPVLSRYHRDLLIEDQIQVC